MINEQHMLTPNSPAGAKSVRDSERGSFTGVTNESHVLHKGEKVRLRKLLTNVSFLFGDLIDPRSNEDAARIQPTGETFTLPHIENLLKVVVRCSLHRVYFCAVHIFGFDMPEIQPEAGHINHRTSSPWAITSIKFILFLSS
jgi:hypothetical protein